MKPPRLLICTGPTGGHFFPAYALAETVIREMPGAEIHFLMNKLSDFAADYCHHLPVYLHVIPFSPPRRLFSLKARTVLLEYAKAIEQTDGLLTQLKPDAVLSFGSYGTIFGVLCAAHQGIPVMLHEQNRIAGFANQFLSFWADYVAESFPDTRGIRRSKKVIYSGYPLRSSFFQSKGQEVPEAGNVFRLFVMGGSQGARHLNETLVRTIAAFEPEEKARFAVIHITGNHDPDVIREAYRTAGVRAEVMPFTDKVSEYLKQADLVIARAGAGTIFELAAVGCASILVPYPGAYAHQRVNAEYLTDRGWARLVDESDLTPQRLRQEILQLKSDDQARHRMAREIKQLFKEDASRVLMEATWKLPHE